MVLLLVGVDAVVLVHIDSCTSCPLRFSIPTVHHHPYTSMTMARSVYGHGPSSNNCEIKQDKRRVRPIGRSSSESTFQALCLGFFRWLPWWNLDAKMLDWIWLKHIFSASQNEIMGMFYTYSLCHAGMFWCFSLKMWTHEVMKRRTRKRVERKWKETTVPSIAASLNFTRFGIFVQLRASHAILRNSNKGPMEPACKIQFWCLLCIGWNVAWHHWGEENHCISCWSV